MPKTISEGRNGSRQKVTGRMVFICLVTFFAVVTGANAVLIRAALSTFGGLEAPSSYQAGQMFAHETGLARAQEAQHWRVEGKLSPTPEGATRIGVIASDIAGRPLAGLEATVTLAHPADRRRDLTMVLLEQTPGRFGGLAAAASGQWDLVIELTQSGKRLFRSRNRVSVP